MRVQFERVEIFRVLEEFPLSTEESPQSFEGWSKTNFAYRMEGTAFWLSQSRAFRETHTKALHYRFITGDSSLDVIAEVVPTFSFVPWEGVPG